MCAADTYLMIPTFKLYRKYHKPLFFNKDIEIDRYISVALPKDKKRYW